MIRDDQLPELAAFRDIEKNMPIWYAPAYSDLVVSSRNESRPVHRWFRFKEGFSSDLLKTIIPSLDLPVAKSLNFLDPFCGSGTSLLSCSEIPSQRFKGIGFEINPFIAFVASVKANWNKINPERLLSLGECALSKSLSISPQLPCLSSISDARCINIDVSLQLLAVRDAIRSLADDAEANALLLGLAASIEALSKVRKDGRALRIVEKAKQPVFATLREKWTMIAKDVQARRASISKATPSKVILGDGRRPLKYGIRPSSIDLIVTSPPYPNTIDYTEVYKLELWFLGFVDTAEKFLGLRRETLRSHPTAAPLENDAHFHLGPGHSELRKLIDPMLERADASSQKWRRRLLVGYFSDLHNALSQHYQCLKPGGYEVLVVGNSLHGGAAFPYLVPTDLIISVMAPILGFTVESTLVARSLKRRLSGNHFLRESVIVLRKSNA
ncbi:MAG: site-specific DNA-methyltransferase [Acidobacteria bacterium]|nr:site-specific DNA-methyltransferase [Acidobacteriota bacterium]